MNKEESNEAFQARVLEAIQKSELSPQEIVRSNCRVCLIIKIYGDQIFDRLKYFILILDKLKLRYNSSFSPKVGIMNISVFKK
ncbi:hypothetical protein [Emticicia sp. TH156]|uniref:hypothetical protein n=1 Tax=Emticicia sp. TH156 TaxID=2067454 RepID=UPI000C778E9F|nr:hypothetical protein [Emticicia sp. TH156]PLK45837.1 hypothetical protein C0V77_00315 [Emticicia sp. TH156]